MLLLIFRERGGEKEKNIDVIEKTDWLYPIDTLTRDLGIKPAT